MSWTTATATYSEDSSTLAGTLAVYQGGTTTLTQDLLYYITVQGYTTAGTSGVLSPAAWFITWDQTASTAGYANGVAPSIPSEIYVGGYNTSTGDTYSDIWNFNLKPNGIWTLTAVKSSTTNSTAHPTEAFFVGYDSVNNLTYTKQLTFTC